MGGSLDLLLHRSLTVSVLLHMDKAQETLDAGFKYKCISQASMCAIHDRILMSEKYSRFCKVLGQPWPDG